MVRSARLLITAVSLIIILLVGGTLFARGAAADTSTPPLPQGSLPSSFPNTNSDVQFNQHTYTQSVFIETMDAVICQLIGIDAIDPAHGCLSIDPTTKKLGYAPLKKGQIGGVVGASTQMIAGLYNVPIHTSTYTNYIAGNFGIVKSANAQTNGTGYDSFRALLDLWIASRNFAYFLFVFIFILIGLGIMLRIKIDPRTVMAVQNQIPKVIIGIILITLSYAVSGFLVDAMWVVTYAGINTFSGTKICDNDHPNQYVSVASDVETSPISYVWHVLADVPECYRGEGAQLPVAGYTIPLTDRGITGLAAHVGATLGDIMSRTVSDIFGGNGTFGDCDISHLKNCGKILVLDAIKYFVSISATLIVAIAIVVSLIRVWLQLIKCYARILMYVVLGPIWIMAGLLPNNTLGFGKWVRTFIANLLVFPATVFLFVLAGRFAANSNLNNPKGNFIPPLIGNPNLLDNIGMIAAFGFILISPEVINLVRDALKSPASKYGQAIGRGLGSGGAPTSKFGGAVWNRFTRMHNLQTGEEAGFLRRWAVGRPNTLRSTLIRPLIGGTGKSGGGH